VCVPEDRRAYGGRVALWSVERISTMSVTPVTVVHWSSHARTVNGKGMPATWARGTPHLPLVVPGAAGCPPLQTSRRARGRATAPPGLRGGGGVRGTAPRAGGCALGEIQQRGTGVLRCPEGELHLASIRAAESDRVWRPITDRAPGGTSPLDPAEIGSRS